MTEKLSFNEWMNETYGIYPDDLTDEDWDMFYAEYEEAMTYKPEIDELIG